MIITEIVEMLGIGTEVASSMPMNAANIFPLLSRMLRSPVKKQYVQSCFQEILQFLIHDQSNHQQQYYSARLKHCTTFGTYGIKSCSTSNPSATAIAFISDFIYNFPLASHMLSWARDSQSQEPWARRSPSVPPFSPAQQRIPGPHNFIRPGKR